MINFLSYQDTNTPWIGEIPTGWSLKSLKHIFTEKKSTKNSDLGCGSISFGKVIYKDDEKIPESTKESYQEVLDGEFLINPLNLNYDLKSLRIGLSRINVVVSQGYIVLNIKDGFVPEYYEYLLRKFDVEHMKSLGQGVRQTISYTHLKDEKLVVPPVDEQKRISRYLDKKTSLIDSLINKIEKKIELLKEQRISLVNQYVTKGLAPNVDMKDSGVEWIGKIPKHWEITPLFTLFEENKVKNKEGRLDVLTLSYGKIKYRDLSKLEGLIPESFDGYQVMKIESIIVRSTDLQNDHKSLRVGHVGVPGVITSAYLGLNPKQPMSTKFYYYSIHLSDLKKVLYGLGGGLRQSLRFDDFKRFPIINPPEDEREKISNHLDRVDKEITDITSKLEKRISLMEEYRHSLISSVVTGKVRVTEDMV
jgi:type I restriction enzyme S subunit